MKNPTFINEEYYHIYNRGVDKRIIFKNKNDLRRFFQSMDEFNIIDPIGSIYENSFTRINIKEKTSLGSRTPKSTTFKLKKDKLVNFVCYCLNPNHYHFLLQQLVDDGIPKFMHKIGTGYTNYFNEKYKRSGSLCQGKYKAIHIDSNEYLLHLSAYINLNYKVHDYNLLGSRTPKLIKSSWEEYVEDNDNKNKKDFCEKDIILDQFGNIEDYKGFTKDSLKEIKENKQIKKLLLEY